MELVFAAVVLSALAYIVLTFIRIERFGNFVGQKLDSDHKKRMAVMEDRDVIVSGLKRVKLAMSRYPLIDVEKTYETFMVSRVWNWNFENIIVYRENDSLIDIVKRSDENNEDTNRF
tara:strand:+ start:141 stop:491 length:351 start_codon:yes stop_codon:yes gene_type:complete